MSLEWIGFAVAGLLALAYFAANRSYERTSLRESRERAEAGLTEWQKDLRARQQAELSPDGARPAPREAPRT